jgi:hypothetical protein
MPHAVDLTTLTDLKNYISPALGQTTASDSALTKIITAVSDGINRYVSRTLAVGTFAEVRNGNGRRSMRALIYPVLNVSSVVLAGFYGETGHVILPSTNGSASHLSWDKWFINLRDECFWEGRQNITLNYSGGFMTPGQLGVLTLPGWTPNTVIGMTTTTVTNMWQTGETPSGLVNGVNKVFTLSHAPSPATGLLMSVRGFVQAQGVGEDYTLVGNTITFTVAPSPGAVIQAFYPYQQTTITTTAASNAQIQVGGFYYESVNSGTTGDTAPGTWLQTRNSLTNDNGIFWRCEGAIPVLPSNASMVPDDYQMACMQQSALLFKNRTRVGDTGSGVGPDRINYFLKDAHPSTISMLDKHREVFPTDGMGTV